MVPESLVEPEGPVVPGALGGLDIPPGQPGVLWAGTGSGEPGPNPAREGLAGEVALGVPSQGSGRRGGDPGGVVPPLVPLPREG